MERVTKEEAERVRKEKVEVDSLRGEEKEQSKAKMVIGLDHDMADIIGPRFLYGRDEDAIGDEEGEDEGTTGRGVRRQGRRHQGSGQME
jgi:hypothetical protein